QQQRQQNKSVAFAIRTNVAYLGSDDDDPPMPGYVISFQVKDFIHIKEKYNNEWWIGRLVKEGCQVGFVPSPSKLQSILQNQAKLQALKFVGNENGSNGFNNSSNNNNLYNNNMNSSSTEKISKKKLFFKKSTNIPPYEVVPAMRPIVLIGPSLKGYEVTDMMQKALFDFLKKKFDNRIITMRVTTDISLVKRSSTSSSSASTTAACAGIVEKKYHHYHHHLERSSSRNASGLDEVQLEIERIFELSRSMNLLLLDCDTINHPSQLSKSPLAPILVHLKITSLKVLQKLVRTRGKQQNRSLNVQLAAAERLSQCGPDTFDVVLDENLLDDACEHLAEYLEAYWNAAHYKSGQSLVVISWLNLSFAFSKFTCECILIVSYVWTLNITYALFLFLMIRYC
ncbi:hypothetical protein HELRODRAFT_81599, partial [Helobdella robusta]|uniref:Guanylate kinase/L-type calcium channel beta subunit domain-containing protein n=1 Tax=Helobdella robusta TaxID=6412 RepID=T1G4G2_HELRO